MPFAVLGVHRDFFRKHQWIECAQLLTPMQLDKLLQAVQSGLSKRLKQPVSLTEGGSAPLSVDTLFLNGRDLWREEREIKKILLNKSLAEVAANLLELKPLRFGYDQLLIPPLSSWQAKNIRIGSQQFQNSSLQEMSCIQGVVCGALICMQAAAQVDTETFFPTQRGHTLFFTPTCPLPLEELAHLPGFAYEMIVYCKPNAVYYLQAKDPLTHAFKRWGYNFGDALKDSLNPIVYS